MGRVGRQAGEEGGKRMRQVVGRVKREKGRAEECDLTGEEEDENGARRGKGKNGRRLIRGGKIEETGVERGRG